MSYKSKELGSCTMIILTSIGKMKLKQVYRYQFIDKRKRYLFFFVQTMIIACLVKNMEVQ